MAGEDLIRRNGVVIPQYRNEGDTAFEAVTGKNGGINVNATIVGSLANNVTDALPVQLSGSNMELYGAVIGNRPAANTVLAGTTFTIIDDTLEFDSYISDGTDWMEV